MARCVAFVIAKQRSQYISQLEYVGIGQYENYRPGHVNLKPPSLRSVGFKFTCPGL